MSAAPPAFVHDLATCVGCDACVVACASENAHARPAASGGRSVTFNEDRHPGLPVFHLSLACNHCLDAPCERHCPALAIARDDRTGAVLIDADRCIGCRYCSWVCPYDAPRFDAGRGVMGKCTLCHHRLRGGGKPRLCQRVPDRRAEAGDARRRRATERGQASPTSGSGPRSASCRCGAVRPIPRREEAAAAAGVATPEPWPAPPRKISLRSEWTLFAFTSLVIGLVAWLASSLLGGPAVHPVPFLILGAAGLALSTLHLGRKERAWRAALNWRRSWLSREVMAVPLFLALAAVHLLLAPADRLAGALAVAAGVAALVCMDRVYVVMAREKRPRVDDVAAVTSALLLAGALAAEPWLFVPASLLRLGAFFERLRRGGEARDVGSLVGAAHRPRMPGARLGLAAGELTPALRRVDAGRGGRARRPRPLLRLARGPHPAQPDDGRPRGSLDGARVLLESRFHNRPRAGVGGQWRADVRVSAET